MSTWVGRKEQFCSNDNDFVHGTLGFVRKMTSEALTVGILESFHAGCCHAVPRRALWKYVCVCEQRNFALRGDCIVLVPRVAEILAAYTATHKDVPFASDLGVVRLRIQVDLEVAKVDVSYIDSFVKMHGFVAW